VAGVSWLAAVLLTHAMNAQPPAHPWRCAIVSAAAACALDLDHFVTAGKLKIKVSVGHGGPWRLSV